MLVDAAKGGDVEIPVFCYEPKLGGPVGACRMCLVEVEGIPKLQTACSTPVRDGMVVYTQTERVKDSQSAVVEFLLVNHPLDCPVCDKGGECPLQDIAMGWGPGRSRYTEPKRHFRKPVAALAAGQDRPRALHPLLPLRAVQPRGLRGRAAPAPRPRRGQLRRDLQRPPLHRPLPRQHHRALPGRGADLGGLPVSRPTLGDRGLGFDLHALPEPVQRQVHGPRRAGRAGAGARQPRGRRRLALRQGAIRLPDDRLRRAGHRAAARRLAGGLGPGPRRDRRSFARRRAAGGCDRRRTARRTRRATWSSGSFARRSADANVTCVDELEAGALRALSAPGARRSDSRSRPGRVDPGPRRRPAERDADPRPAAAQGDPPRRRPGGGRLRAPDRARRRCRGERAVRARRGGAVPRRAGRRARRRRRRREASSARTPSASPACFARARR